MFLHSLEHANKHFHLKDSDRSIDEPQNGFYCADITNCVYFFSMRKCGKCCCTCQEDNTVLVEDNCCECNYAAMRKLGRFKNSDLIYVTYHVDVSTYRYFYSDDTCISNLYIRVHVRGSIGQQVWHPR